MSRKQYSLEMKMQIVKEAMETGNASSVARRHDVAPSLVACWARCYKRYGTFYPQKEVPETNGSCIPPDYKKIIKENWNLHISGNANLPATGIYCTGTVTITGGCKIGGLIYAGNGVRFCGNPEVKGVVLTPAAAELCGNLSDDMVIVEKYLLWLRF